MKNGRYTDICAISHVVFAGLRPACEMIDKEYNGKIRTFRGGESAEETLLIMGVPETGMANLMVAVCLLTENKNIVTFGKLRIPCL